MDYKFILQELDTVPKEVIDICAGVDESSLTPYLELRNIVTSLDIEAADNLEEIEREVREELSRYGEVKEVLIPPMGSSNQELVLVEYAEAQQVCGKDRNSIHL